MKKLLLTLTLIFLAFPSIGYAEENACKTNKDCSDSEMCIPKDSSTGTCVSIIILQRSAP